MKINNWITLILVFTILSTLGLVYVEINTPGTCPSYFIAGLPACIVMGIYFTLMLIFHLSDWKYTKISFYLISVVAFISASVFSIKEILGIGSCPRAFDIPLPLCFAAWVMILITLILKHKTSKP
jgi:hypothetical protein